MRRSIALFPAIVIAAFLYCYHTDLRAQDSPPAVSDECATVQSYRRVLAQVRDSATVSEVVADLDLSDTRILTAFIQVLCFARLVDFGEERRLFDWQSESWKSWVESHATARVGPISPAQDAAFFAACEDRFWSHSTQWQSSCSVDFIRFGQPTVAETYHLLNSPNAWTRLDGLYVMARVHPDEFRSRSRGMGDESDALLRAGRMILRCALGCEDKAQRLEFTLAEGASFAPESRPVPGEKGVCAELWYNLYRALVSRLLIMQLEPMSAVSQSEWERISKRKKRD